MTSNWGSWNSIQSDEGQRDLTVWWNAMLDDSTALGEFYNNLRDNNEALANEEGLTLGQLVECKLSEDSKTLYFEWETVES